MLEKSRDCLPSETRKRNTGRRARKTPRARDRGDPARITDTVYDD
jgi:hypothetical protein